MTDPDAPAPERRKYGLKRVDPQAREAPDEPPPRVLTVQEMAQMAGVHHAPKDHAPGAVTAKDGDPNDVISLRHELRAREIADDRDRIEIRKKKSRRKRDYWLLMIALNSALGTVLGYGLLHGNPVLMIYAFAGIVMGSLGITWVMWFIMSDY